MHLIVERDRQPRLRVDWEADARRNLHELVGAIEGQEARARRARDVRELRRQERRGGAEIRRFRDDGEELGEPLSGKLGYRWYGASLTR